MVVPGIARTAKNIVDPLKRETEPGANPEADIQHPEKDEFGEVRRLINEARATLPGLSTSLPPRRNLWGDPIEVPKGWPVEWLSPVFTSQRKNDPAGDEIVRLGHAGLLTVDRAPRVILGSDPATHPIDKPASPMETGIELTDAEYDQFVRLAGNELKIDGKGMHEKLNEVIGSDPDFKGASDVVRANVITRIVNGYRKAAIGELLKPNEDGTDSAIMQSYKARLAVKEQAMQPRIQLPPEAPQVQGNGTFHGVRIAPR